MEITALIPLLRIQAVDLFQNGMEPTCILLAALELRVKALICANKMAACQPVMRRLLPRIPCSYQAPSGLRPWLM